MDLDPLLRFTQLIHRFLKIERVPFAAGTDRRENDVEHSYQLALTAWYLNNKHGLGMDTEKLLKYALAHDLVEIYAGDTPAFTTDLELRTTKQAREADGAVELARNYPDFPEVHTTIAAYERRADREATFVYALDKILPVMNTYLDGGRSWRNHKITLDMILAYKVDKVKLSPEVDQYFNALVATMRQNESDLFGPDK